VNPAGILGVEGIYDLERLRDDHKDLSMYQYLIKIHLGRMKKIESWRAQLRKRGREVLHGRKRR
jgi:hypothetical protein